MIVLILCILLYFLSYIVYRIYKENVAHSERQKLPGKVVVITGASSGIGESLAREFYAAGCKVVLASRRPGELERVRSQLLNLQLNNGLPLIRPEIVQLDLEEIHRIPTKCQQILNLCDHVDILINNAGISLRSDVLTVKTEVDIKLININYIGAITLTKGLLPSMIKRRQGTIAFVSSVVGRLPIPYRSAYTASKHALQAFADCLRAEIASYNVNVFVSSPGYVATNVSRNALTGYGTTYGVTDPETAAGETPKKCAAQIMHSILAGDKESLPFIYAIAVWFRATIPSLYFYAMEKRAMRLAARHSNTQVI